MQAETHTGEARGDYTIGRRRNTGRVRFGLVALTAGAVLVTGAPVVTQIALPTAPAAAAPATLPPVVQSAEMVQSTPGFGKTEGSFAVSGDGAAQYTVPMSVPDGRGMVEPELTLSYNSRAGNGPLGVGWELTGLPSVTRCQRTFAQDGYADRFHLNRNDAYCLAGRRLMPVTPLPPPPAQLQQREYRTEQESFARVIAYGMEDLVPNFFKVWTKDGKILSLGVTPDSRQAVYPLTTDEFGQATRSSTTRAVVAWAVNRVEDRNGNAASVSYTHLDGDFDGSWWTHMRPATITYAPNRQVVFGYANRPDPVDGFGAGVHTRFPVRLTSVSMFAGSQGESAAKVREYRLSYRDQDGDSITGRSLLAAVVECDGAGICKKPVNFSWTVGSYQWQPIDTNVTDLQDSEPGSLAGSLLTVGDITGDGRDDLLYRNEDDVWTVRHSTGSGFAQPIAAGIPTLPMDSLSAGLRNSVRVVDVDADGRMDVMLEVADGSEGGSGWRLYRSDGTRFVAHPGNVGYFGPDDGSLDPVYFLDLDGNGLPDLLRGEYEPPADHDPDALVSAWAYRLNSGVPGATRFGPERRFSIGGVPFQNTVADSDGDGREELVGRYLVNGALAARALGLDDTGTLRTEPSTLPTGLHMGDVNGDGLTDAVDSFHAGLNSHISLGNKQTYDQGGELGYVPPREHEGPGGGLFDRGARIVDVNNDGREDLLVFQGGKPNGSGDVHHGLQLHLWANPTTWRSGGFARVPLEEDAGEPHDVVGFAESQPADIDGDGALDIVHRQGGYLRILRRTGGVPDRLTGVDGPARERIEIDYTTLADGSVHTPVTSCTYPQVCLSKGGTVVAEHRAWTFASTGGDAGWDRYTHTYVGAKSDTHGRGWLGFSSHVVTRALTGAQTHTAFDNTTRNDNIDAYPFALMPREVTTNVNDSPTGRRHQTDTLTEYSVRRHPGGGYSVEPTKVTTTKRERPVSGGTWQTLRENVTTPLFDDYGNVALSTSATTGGRTVEENPTYRNDTTNWLLGLVTKNTTKACTPDLPCKTRTTSADYDDKGQQTFAVVEPNTSDLLLRTETKYDQFGNVTSVTRTDSADHSRKDRFEYTDTDKVHPTAAVNALGHKTVIETHPGLGVPQRTTDPNGVATTMQYDGFGRLRATHHADGSSTTITHSLIQGLDQVKTATSDGGQTEVSTDALGREIVNRAKSFDGSFASTLTHYDPLGRARLVSRPKADGATAQYTTAAYDNLDRPVRVTAPDGVFIRHEYLNREAHTYDGRRTHSYTVSTVDGEIGSRFEDDPLSTGWLRTRYAYGPFGEATRVTAVDDTVQIMEYDPLGRRTKLTDPSTGVTTTSYNAFGEITTETDGNGQVTTITHDALGRATSTSSPDGTATNVWDTAAHGKGLLARATSPDGVVTVKTYTEHSKPETSTWTVEGVGYQIGYAYDRFGRPSQITYPAIPGAPASAGRLKADYVYNPAGYLSQVKDPAPDGPVYWTAVSRNSAGQLTRENLGNGTHNRWTYDDSTGLVETIESAIGDYPHILDYFYDDDRNVTRRVTNNGRSEEYAYDDLDRLQTWTLRNDGVTTTTGFAYDKIGNLKTEVVSGEPPGQPQRDATYTYGASDAPPHALTGRNGAAYTYDDAGRQITGDGRTLTYNQTGLPKFLTWGQTQRTDFRYDAAGARVLKRNGSSSLVTIGGLFERRNPAGTGSTQLHNLHNIVADGRVVAQVNRIQATPTSSPSPDPVVRYLHADLQGSTTLVTNEAGRPADDDASWLQDLFYDPFGRRVQGDGTPLGDQARGGPHQGYTSHGHDDDLGLINMKGRIYDPEHRRFLTPDTLIPDPLSGQDYNRYAYVRNNPVTLTDPTGHIVEQGPYSAGPSAFGSAWLENHTGGGFLSAIALQPSFPLTRPLVTEIHQMFLGGGGPTGAADDDDGAVTKSDVAAGVGIADSILDMAGSAKLPGAWGSLAEFLGTLVDVISVGTEGWEPDTSGGTVSDLWETFRWMGGLAEALMATTTMAYLAAGAETIGAAFAAAAEALPFAAFFAQASAIVGVLAGAAGLGMYLRELSGLTDEDLFQPIGEAAVAHGEAQIAFWGTVAGSVVAGVESGARGQVAQTEAQAAFGREFRVQLGSGIDAANSWLSDSLEIKEPELFIQIMLDIP